MQKLFSGGKSLTKRQNTILEKKQNQDLGLGQGFLDLIPTAQCIKGKIENWISSQLKSCSMEDPVEGIKRQAT